MKKYRPALVISEITQQTDPRYVLVTPLTTRKALKKTPLEIELTDSPFLKRKSYALLWQPLTIDIERVQHIMGEVPPKLTKAMQKRLRGMFE